MERTKLDDLFDESLSRLDRKSDPLGPAYGGSPLAADHLLLRKSWDYFRSRVRAIEDHWKAIARAKDEQSSALAKEIAELRAAVRDLEERNEQLTLFEERVRETGLADQRGFRRDHERLQLAWEEERAALEGRVEELESALKSVRAETKALEEKQAASDAAWRARVAAARDEASSSASRATDNSEEWRRTLAEKDDRLASLDAKVDLLRSEVERRDVDARAANENQESLRRDLAASNTERDNAVQARRLAEAEAARVAAERDAARRETEDLRARHAREQAEWRELWERARDLWERRRSSENAPKNMEFPEG